MDYKGKVAIVTGTACGIGRAIAASLAKEGADIVGFDVLTAPNEEVMREVQKMGHNGIAMQVDITDKHAVLSAVERVVKTFGRIDILVNNAGLYKGARILDDDYDTLIDVFDQCMAVNARGTWSLIVAAIPHLVKQGGGHIINIITHHVKREYHPHKPGLGFSAYDASKFAMWSINDTMASELKAVNIRVNGICPAATYTAQIRDYYQKRGLDDSYEAILADQKRMMRPEEVATAVINVLNWAPDGPVGRAETIETREDCEKLANY